jgi:hypothetical protein
MKTNHFPATTVLLSIVMSVSVGALAQQTMPPAGGTSAGVQPPGRGFGAGTPGTSTAVQPFQTNQLGLLTNQSPFVTNPLSPTSRILQTNANQRPFGPQTINFSVTNTLSTMAAVQAQNVFQVQSALNAMQNLAVNLGAVQNVQEIAQQNPQVQQQIQQVARQIQSLAQGPVRPSATTVERLSQDLFRAVAPVQMSPDRQLVLAVIINQACNSGNMTPAQIQDAVNTGLAVLQSAGVPQSTAHLVGCDLHAIALEMQPGLMF